nr:unnamed protein product [Callosobruchus analis]
MKRAFKYTASYYRHKKRLCREQTLQAQACLDGSQAFILNSIDQQSDSSSSSGEEPKEENPNNGGGVNLEGANLTEVEEISETEELRQPPQDTLGSKILKFLPNWAIEYKISHVAVNALLKNLISSGVSGLPKDSRTLIGTPRTVEIEKMGNGYFWYHGLENCLSGIENYIDKKALNTLDLSFNIDGLPIANSSKSQFWPVLVNVINVEQFAPQIVAIFSGDSKPPSVKDYLQKFVAELQKLLEIGLHINNVSYSINIVNFICDTPARVVSFNAYHSCLRCTVVGEYYTQQKRMSFPQLDYTLRSDKEFRAKTDANHHQKNQDEDFIISPLEHLPIDMVQDIIIADSLHLLHL